MASSPRRRVVWFSLACALACGPKPGAETTDTTDSPATTGPGTTGSASTAGDTTLLETTSTTSGNPTTASSTAPNPTTANPTTTSDSGETTDTTGTSFIIVPDVGGDVCPGVAASFCDPWSQETCGRDEKCAPSGGGCDVFIHTICDDLPPQPVPIGGACTSEVGPLSGRNDCERGATCWFIDPDTLLGTCVGLCHGSHEAPDCAHVPGTACVFVHDEPFSAPLCLPTCDPFEPTCPEKHHCHPTWAAPEVFACTPDALPPLGAAFEPCAKTDCAAGLLCSEPETAAIECAPGFNCCTPLCDLDTPDCPGAGQVCLPYYEMGQAPAGLEDLGRCALP
ncbi:hypothetical protein SAMN02745121_03505 [Nannocystis exedens]|uniref:Uncharacterized protein n=1 Tax=Nannocystis exedens TaxID=54 RepID=A0A1I1YRX9_9BACT|nr:hypothetical protein [Nannocystis exedens]PCC70174.1 hypothetical protein NAEX_03207 [Nannocystis exedens]SFE22365.1 hypothetical protein SAMN02745121_03505 [Nannocystis exedens]